ncbi:MAG: hypothetical protein WKF63_03100, partial [Thermomicrobiales bacterium]
NGLMIKALASSGSALGRTDLIDAARAAAALVFASGIRKNGHLVRTMTAGQPAGAGMLEDYAFLADGLTALHAATGEHCWLEHAQSLANTIVEQFAHSDGPGFFDTSLDHEQLIIRPRELQDGAIPCGNSVAIDVLLTLSHLREDEQLSVYVDSLLSSLAVPMAEHPTAFGRFLAVLERILADQRQLVLAGGGDVSTLRSAYVARYEPFVTLAYATTGEERAAWPTLGERPLPAGAGAAAYICQGKTCLPPVTRPAELIAQLDAAVR